MDLSSITVADFKAFFRRDFPYAPTLAANAVCSNLDAYVFDFDITKAFSEADLLLNQALFSSDANITLGYLYLTAHYLANDMRTAQAGIESTASFPVSSRSVGSVAEAYQIPDSYKDNPSLAFYTTTGYGMKYLSMVLPATVGNIGAICGGTNP